MNTYRQHIDSFFSVALAALLLLTAGCTDAPLEAAPYPTKAKGQYCTNSASTYDLPIRILLAIDTSKSMELNDPQDYRAKAAADLVTNFSSHPNVSFAFIEFNTAATEATDGFVRDPPVIVAALNQLTKKEGFTNYTDTIALTESFIEADVEQVAAELRAMEEAGDNSRFARPWYFVVFLSDGIPRMPGGVLQDTDDILWRVSQLMDIPQEAAGVTLHTAFLGSAQDAQQADAEALLQRMASAGGGTYTSFANGEQIDFSVFDFSVRRLFDVKQFLVYNRTAVLTDLSLQPDSDGDGICDADERRNGTDPRAADTDGDGCSDGFEIVAGLADSGMCPCSTDGTRDSDNDGLTDCEELFLNYNPKRFDTDGDLFPDGLELRVGLNAADGADWKEDLDFDGVTSGAEVHQGTNPIRADQDMVARYGLRYNVDKETDAETQQTCYVFSVHNVTLTNTLAVDGRADGINEIVFEFIESPEDAAEEVFTLRRSVVSLRFSRNSPETIVVPEDSFEVVSQQDINHEE